MKLKKFDYQFLGIYILACILFPISVLADDSSAELSRINQTLQELKSDIRDLKTQIVVIREQQGQKGEKGDRGNKGARGNTGEKGDTGPRGEKGDSASCKLVAMTSVFHSSDPSWAPSPPLTHGLRDYAGSNEDCGAGYVRRGSVLVGDYKGSYPRWNAKAIKLCCKQ